MEPIESVEIKATSKKERTRAYQFRLYPTVAQERALSLSVSLCQRLYNTALEQRILAYKLRRKTLSAYTQSSEITSLKAAFPEFKKVNAHVLQNVLSRLDKAYASFFRRIKLGQKAGFPRFKAWDRYHSFTLVQEGFKLNESKKRVLLSKIGHVKVKAWCALPTEPKSVIISHKADGWYVTFVCTNIPANHLPLTGKEIGLDLGLTKFITTSENETLGDIDPLKKAEKEIREVQSALDQKVKGSNRRKKAQKHFAKAYQHLTRVRKAGLDILTKDIVQRFDTICAEKLDVAEMVSKDKDKDKTKPSPKFINKTGLRRNINIAAWGTFISILSYKAEEAGKKLILVNPRGTSQECSGCGKVVKKDLTVRVHECPHCGILLDRDHNAAINILQRGLRLLQVGSKNLDPCAVHLSSEPEKVAA